MSAEAENGKANSKGQHECAGRADQPGSQRPIREPDRRQGRQGQKSQPHERVEGLDNERDEAAPARAHATWVIPIEPRPGHAQPHANRDDAYAQDQGANGCVDEGDDAKMTPDRRAQHEKDIQAGKREIRGQEFTAQELPTAERRCFEQPPRFTFHADAGQRNAREDEGGDEKDAAGEGDLGQGQRTVVFKATEHLAEIGAVARPGVGHDVQIDERHQEQRREHLGEVAQVAWDDAPILERDRQQAGRGDQRAAAPCPRAVTRTAPRRSSALHARPAAGVQAIGQDHAHSEKAEGDKQKKGQVEQADANPPVAGGHQAATGDQRGQGHGRQTLNGRQQGLWVGFKLCKTLDPQARGLAEQAAAEAKDGRNEAEDFAHTVGRGEARHQHHRERADARGEQGRPQQGK